MTGIEIALGVATIYFAAKYIKSHLTMMAYIYWTVEKRHAQPTENELKACMKEVIRQMLK